MNDLRSRLAALDPEQRSRLVERLRRERSPGDLTQIAAANRTLPLPLSFAQRRVWFIERLEGRSAAYNMPAAFRIEGDLDRAALVAAFDEIVCRHEVLRTRLIDHDGEPAQVIDPVPAPGSAALCRLLSLSELTADAREDALRVVLRDEASHVFDLEAEHPIRVQLVWLEAREHVLIVTLHHAASDGWSTGILVRECAALYNGLRAGTGSPLAPLPLQYADFARWQRQHLEDAAVAEPHLDYWRTHLATAPGAINLPADGHSGGGGEAVYFRIDAGVAEAVKALAHRTDASAYMVLLAAFLVLLHRWSGDTDLTIGSPIANRPRKEFEGLIGFFVNTLALRVSVDGEPDFLEVIARVRTVALEAYSHADLPFEQIVEKLNPERQLTRSPFFQLMFAMQSGPLDAVSLDGLRIESIPLSTGAARFDLTMSIQETGTGFAGCLEFASALFRPETAQRFAEHFRNMVGAAVRQPTAAVSTIDYLAHGERHRLLVEWNRTEMPARSHCLHHLFEEQAARTPDAIAVRWNGLTWTYDALLAKASQTALLLQQKGVGTETLVGVCMSRSPEMIAALLGVLRAGGAYVALDPAYPVARTEYVLANCGAALVLRDGDLDETVAAGDFRPPTVGPSNLAYVLYTSGSTGQPKGVAIEHRSPSALIAWAQTVWSPAELSGVLAGTSICFDLSVFEIFLPLSLGGCVVLANSVLDLPELVDRSHVTLINTVPSAIDALLHQRALPPGVRVVNLAGEPLSTELADRIYDVPTVEKVYDLYGPSEDTTYSTFVLRRRGDAPTIGRPIANTHLYILDGALQPVPVGVPGEIYLAGQGLARGYLGRPDLTDERFVPSPFAGVDRLYRTGDRARFRDDGNVEFLGRFDYQVKLRGFRIELGEIEAVARSFPDAGQCVVTVEEGDAGNRRLVAFLAHPKGQAMSAALQAHLRARLPDYMVPPVVVILETLPLTPNGKIDRQRLPSRDRRSVPEVHGALTAEESRLAALWQRLLAVDRVRPLDDFFGLGGHSLLAAKLSARIRDTFRVDLPLRAIFEQPTLRAQAAAIADLRPDASGGEAIPSIRREGQLAMSFAQERLWFLDQLEPGNAAYHMAGALRLYGDVDVPALSLAFDQVVERQEALRTVFPTIGGRGFASLGGIPPRLLEIDGGEQVAIDTFLRVEQARPFDLAAGPLVRVTLIRVGAGESVLAVSMHHIISDGRSIEVFLDELCRFYGARATGATAAPESLPVQYLDFAAWQRRRFDAGLMAPHLDYWRESLGGAPAVLELPTDRARPELQSYRGAAYAMTLGEPLTSLLSQCARDSGATSFMVLLAGFAAALRQWSGQEDMVIGFPAAGRSRSDLEPAIGMFVNTVPIRIQVPDGISFSSLVAQVRTRTLDALTHQEVPFEKLVDALGVKRNLSRPPLFQVMFITQQAGQAARAPEGLRVEPIASTDTGTTKFDLTLAVTATASGLSVSLEYDRALFDATTIERFASDYVALLTTGLEGPAGPLMTWSAPALIAQHAAQSVRPVVAVEVSDGQPATPVETALVGIWRGVLRLDEVRVTDNFFEVGGDSIVAIQVIAQLRDRGWKIDPKQMFRHQTIRALAAVAEPARAPRPTAEDESGPRALSPMQRLFFELNPPSPNHFNQAVLLDVAPDISAASLQEALTETVRVHPALRSRFCAGPNGWEERDQGSPDIRLECRTAADTAAVESVCQAVQRSLDIDAGPVFRAILIEVDRESWRVLLVAHHLVVDAVSWRVILADLEAAYAQALGGGRPSLPPEYCGPAAFRRMTREWSAVAPPGEEDYWTGVTSGASHLFARGDAGHGGPPAGRTVTATFPAAETEPLLIAAHRAYNATAADVLLAALGRALCDVTGRDEILVDVEGHGRDALEDADLSRSVGWFTTLYPVRVSGGTGGDAELIRGVKESTRSVPHGGIGFGLLHTARAAPGSAPLTDVSFNYLGQSAGAGGGGLFRGIAPESVGDPAAADLPRRYRLELNATVIDGRLVTQYVFDEAVLPEALVADVADRTMAALRDLLGHCLAVEGAQYTPSDFSTVSIEQHELDALLGDLDLSGLSEP